MVRPADEKLLRAAEKGDVVAAQAALDEGADPVAHVLGTMTALHVAARDGKTKVVRLLLAKTTYDSDLLRDVHFVASGSVRGRAEVVESIEEALEDAWRREKGLRPVARRPPAPFVPRTHQEALFFAIDEGDIVGARRALDEGADVNAPGDDQGFMPLMAAARSGNLALVELLLGAGADPLPTYIGGNRASDLASTAKHSEITALLRRAEVVTLLKAQRTYLRNFDHLIEGGVGEKHFIFYAAGRFFNAWWAVAEERVQKVRWWTEAEFRQLLSYGLYGDPSGRYFGAFADIPEKVREEAPARAERTEEILRGLAEGTRQLVLDRDRNKKGSPRWFLRQCDSLWLLVLDRDITPIAAERARDEVEESLRRATGPELVPVDEAATRKAATAIKKARSALRRLYAGEVWTVRDQVRWGQNGQLYFGIRKRKSGPVQSASAQTEQSFLGELVSLYARGDRPQIAREPGFHDRVAPLVDEDGLVELLEAGKVALGWNDARLYRGDDGRLVRSGLSSAEEVSRPELLDIVKNRNYAWVERRGRSR